MTQDPARSGSAKGDFDINNASNGDLKNRFFSRLEKLICNPTIDKIIGAVACSPYLIYIYQYFTSDLYNITQAIFAANIIVFIASMYVRRAPARITSKPAHWALAFIAFYGPFSLLIIGDPGVPLVNPIVTTGLAILSFFIFTYARMSLGRAIGIVPSHRGIVVAGAFRWVRHPIYTGIFITYFGFLLGAFSPINFVLLSLFTIVFVIKSFIEEDFLKSDPAYAAYLAKVKWRWFPGIV